MTHRRFMLVISRCHVLVSAVSKTPNALKVNAYLDVLGEKVVLCVLWYTCSTAMVLEEFQHAIHMPSMQERDPLQKLVNCVEILTAIREISSAADRAQRLLSWIV